MTFSWPVRVYYEDTDTGGIVFYANYLKFFERARTEWLRSGGFDQSVLAASDNIMFVVMRTAVDYHSPAKLDNELKLSVTVEKLGRASVEFLQQAWRIDRKDNAQGAAPSHGDDNSAGQATLHDPSHTLIATGRIKVACVDALDLRPRALPQALMEFINGSVREPAGRQ